jgi:hypothetical protein
VTGAFVGIGGGVVSPLGVAFVGKSVPGPSGIGGISGVSEGAGEAEACGEADAAAEAAAVGVGEGSSAAEACASIRGAAARAGSLQPPAIRWTISAAPLAGPMLCGGPAKAACEARFSVSATLSAARTARCRIGLRIRLS